MILFLIKKNFCDGWDNLLSLAFYNCVALALLSAGLFFSVKIPNIIGVCIAFVFLFLFLIELFAVNQTTAKFADFKYVSFKETFLEIPNVIKDALLFAVVIFVLFLIAFYCLPFYYKMNSLLGLFLASVMFWLIAVTVLSLQWFLPIQAQLGNNFKKAFKKCFIIFFDNAGFSVFMFFYTIILAVLSIPLATIIPGFSGILLSYNNAFRLRLYKYDWLEEHEEELKQQGKKKPRIPWGELIADDRETLGPRSLKSFIFPWKD
ncbi:MAG: hypothetical protein MJ159_05220 [Treponemataceae bacterium]|nr:hypothetical protein [Treponemataceae bacterium]